MKKTLALLLAIVMAVGMFAGCGSKNNETPPAAADGTTAPVAEVPAGDYTYNDFVVTLATNWNPHTYETNDDSYPMEFLSAGFYNFFFNDDLHPVEGRESFEGYVVVPEMAADLPVDVTEQIKAEHPEFGIPESANAGYAYTISLNQDACWQDGTPIKAEDYVESFKRLLDPRMNNYRAGNYYESNFSVVGAEQYANQGKSTQPSVSAIMANEGMESLDEFFAKYGEATAYINWNYSFGQAYDFETNEYVAAEDAVVATPLTLNEMWEFYPAQYGEDDASIAAGQAYFPDEVYADWTYASDVDFSTVGLYASDEYELTLVLNKSLAGFNLLYNLTSSWLVKTDVYDSCIKETETAGGTLVTCTYNSSVETTCSYGPYIMDNYQTDKAMHFVKNDNWYGYTDGKHVYVDPTDGETYNMYMTTAVDTQVVSEADTRKMMFLKGQLMTYTLTDEDFATYRNSEFCHFSPGQGCYFIILNGNMNAIKQREAAADFDQSAQDLEMLTVRSFHRAMGLTYDKALWCEENSPADSPAFGLVGPAYIYDPETGARYRDTDQAMTTLCEVYGVDPSEFDSLSDAVASITGYDPVAAKEWYEKAFEEGIELGYITDADGDGICDQTIKITYANGSTEGITERMIKRMNYLTEKANLVTEGTPFEGKILFEMSAPLGNDWSTQLKGGLVDTCMAGWVGGAMDPYGLMEVYTNPGYQYDAAWFNANGTKMTLTLPVDGVDTEITMGLNDWQLAMNGTTVSVNGVEYNFGEGIATADTRLEIMAGIEKQILLTYNYLPFSIAGDMTLLSQKAFYVVDEFNPVLGRGGIQYLKYNYNDAEWDAYVKDQGGELTY